MVVCIAGINFQGLILVNKSSPHATLKQNSPPPCVTSFPKHYHCQASLYNNTILKMRLLIAGVPIGLPNCCAHVVAELNIIGGL